MDNYYKPKCYSYLRFSNPEQAKGDSIRRQLEASTKYAREHGLALDESLTMRDEGISAFRSTHVKKGALGKFLSAINAGKVPLGSYLIVESMDRLSRDEIITALQQFLDIIKSGITIVTLMDGQSYSEQSVNNNPYTIMASLGVMIRANEESLTKSKRLTDKWKIKREIADKKPMTAQCRAWLRLNKKTWKFEKLESRCATVNRIFELALDYGVYSIVMKLNSEKVPTFGKSKAWNVSTVAKILQSREVLGEFQPKSKMDKSPGVLIKEYYPKILSEDLFDRVQVAMKRRKNGQGKVGVIKNLFTHIARCGYCNGTMLQQTRKHSYFICSSAKGGFGCKDSTSMRYDKLESAFLQYSSELDLSTILSGDKYEGELATVKTQLSIVIEKVVVVEQRIQNMIAGIADALDEDTRKSLVLAHDRYSAEKRELKIKQGELEEEIGRLSSLDNSTENHLSKINELSEKLNILHGDELIDLRRQLRIAIAGVVKKVVCYPNGLKDKILAWIGRSLEVVPIDFPSEQADLSMYHNDVNKVAKTKANIAMKRVTYIEQNTGRNNACFFVEFKNGHTRMFVWNTDDQSYEIDAELTNNSLVLGGTALW